MKCTVYREPPSDFHPTVEAAGCYCTYNDKILLLKRNPTRPQGGKWGVPGGKLEKGEDPRSAVIREIYEEVGLDIDDDELKEIGKLYVRLPNLDYVFHMFYKSFQSHPQIKLGLEEHEEAVWVNLDEAYKLPLIAGGVEALEYYLEIINGCI